VQSFQAAQRYVSSRLLATRQGTVLLGLGAALLAGLVLLVYLNRYRDSVSASSEPVSVLVAKRLIEKGTLGEQVALTQGFEIGSIARDHVENGAFVDPSALRGKVAVTDILPGQQMTTADFALSSSSGGIGAGLLRRQRAMALPVASAPGMVGRIQGGDHVDIMANLDLNGRAVVKTIMQDIYVLEAPAGAGGGGIGGQSGATIVLRVTPKQAGKLAFASEEGSLWFVLRPRSGARRVKPALVTVDTVVGG
jgi:pilus assembly protein CpaB